MLSITRTQRTALEGGVYLLGFKGIGNEFPPCKVFVYVWPVHHFSEGFYLAVGSKVPTVFLFPLWLRVLSSLFWNKYFRNNPRIRENMLHCCTPHTWGQLVIWFTRQVACLWLQQSLRWCSLCHQHLNPSHIRVRCPRQVCWRVPVAALRLLTASGSSDFLPNQLLFKSKPPSKLRDDFKFQVSF